MSQLQGSAKSERRDMVVNARQPYGSRIGLSPHRGVLPEDQPPVGAAIYENRRDMRYWSSQRAVILTEGGTGRLCVITNFGKGGLCLAVVGSARRWHHARIGLKANQGTFLCDIVNADKDGLHCGFADPIVDPTLWKILPFAGIAGRHEKSASVDGRHSHRMSGIYAEGCIAGRGQVDPAIDSLDETVDVLNPYHGPEERHRWALGFKDGIRHLARHS
jgi:hypothetical protein